MQQPAVLDGGLDPRTRADHQVENTSHHAAASVGASELVTRASLGEQVAWDQLVERYGAMIWTVARGHGLGLEDAAEVSQVHLAAVDPASRLALAA
jgi:hypothetical protein